MKKTIGASLLAALLAIPVWADEDDFEALEHAVIQHALEKVKIGVHQAMDIGSQEAGDAKLVEAELGLEGDTPTYELDFLAGATVVEITVDAIAGKVIKKEKVNPEPDEAGELAIIGMALGEAGVTLPQAIEAAKLEPKDGTPVAAKAVFHGQLFGFDVRVASSEQFKRIQLDLTGRVIASEPEKTEGQAWIFDQDSGGKPPSEWQFGYTNAADGKAVWNVAQDPKALSGPNVLKLEANSGGSTFNLAIVQTTSYQDVDVRTRLRADSGKEDQGGGLIWRAKDENNYYICRVNPLEGNIRVYKVINGKRHQLQSADAALETGQWAVVRAKMVGQHIQCFFDGAKWLDVTDDTFKDAGRIGLWTKADASSSFDNVAVRPGRASKSDQAPAKASVHGDEDDDDDE